MFFHPTRHEFHPFYPTLTNKYTCFIILPTKLSFIISTLYILFRARNIFYNLCRVFLSPKPVTDITFIATEFLFFYLALKLFSSKLAFMLIEYRVLSYSYLAAFVIAINSFSTSRFIGKWFSTLPTHRIRAILFHLTALTGLYAILGTIFQIIRLAIGKFKTVPIFRLPPPTTEAFYKLLLFLYHLISKQIQ